MQQIGYLIERLSALHRSQMRKFAQEQGLQMVHLEILSYLASCNRYSDTTQALSEYLGHTKSSISQSVGFLETAGLVKRTQDEVDKRVYHLKLSAKSRSLITAFESSFFPTSLSGEQERGLEGLLAAIQRKNGLKSFGICSTCRFNTNPTGRQFICGLTNESLTKDDVTKKCREHQAS